MKLKNKHFEDFKKHCLYYLDKFQLNDWDVYFQFEETESQASSYIQYNGNITITLSTEFNFFDKNVDEYIKYLAKHEALHCLLGRFSSIARDRYINEGELDNEEEHLIRKLCKIIH